MACGRAGAGARRFRPACWPALVVAAAATVLAGAVGAGGPAAAQSVLERPGEGYRLVAADGGVFAFGDARFRGSAGAIRLASAVVGGATTPAGDGYWLVGRDGGVFAFGDARFSGSAGALRLNAPIVAMAASPTGAGYWLAASDGGVFAFGDAPFLGSAAPVAGRAPVVGMAATPTGSGYWLAGADGGVFAFGDAPFLGSAAGRLDGSPVVGIAADGPRGYRLATAAGAVVSFGSAEGAGSLAGRRLAAPVVGPATNAAGGYWLTAADGGVFAFGDARFAGSMAGRRLGAPIVGIGALPEARGESIAPGRYVEQSDTGGFVTLRDGRPEGQGSASTVGPPGAVERLRLRVLWSPADGRAAAQLQNTSAVPLQFPDGLRVMVRVTRNGAPWRELTVADPSVKALAPGAGVSVVGPDAAPPDGDGTYGFVGQTVVVLG